MDFIEDIKDKVEKVGENIDEEIKDILEPERKSKKDLFTKPVIILIGIIAVFLILNQILISGINLRSSY